MLRYAVLRIGLFVVVLLLLYVAGARDLLLLLLAAVISLALSYVLLGRQRAAVAEALAARTEARLRATPRDEEAEDAEADGTARARTDAPDDRR